MGSLICRFSPLLNCCYWQLLSFWQLKPFLMLFPVYLTWRLQSAGCFDYLLLSLKELCFFDSKMKDLSLQFMNLNLLTLNEKRTELSEASPFQSLFGWTKDIVCMQNLLWYVIYNFSFKIQPVDRNVFASRKNISCTLCIPKIGFLNALNRIMPDFKMTQVI